MKNLSQEDSVVQNEAATIKDEELQPSRFVFKNFFEKYSLSESKEILEKWLLSPFEKDKEDAALYYSFKKEIEKALESATLFIKPFEGLEEINFELEEKSFADEKGISQLEHLFSFRDTEVHRELYLLDPLKKNPMSGLIVLFKNSMDDEIKYVLEE